MGETGCGKTRLIRYMCDLQSWGSGGYKTMLMMKVRINFVLAIAKFLFKFVLP